MSQNNNSQNINNNDATENGPNSSVPPTEPPVAPPVRGSNFTTSEHMQLCRSWLIFSADPITGRNQTSGNMWQNTKRDFDAKLRANGTYHADRSVGSLEAQWTKISREVSKFCGFHAFAIRNPASGSNPVDAIQVAHDMYRRARNDKRFGFAHCYTILSAYLKWQAILDKKEEEERRRASVMNRAAASSGSPGSSAGDNGAGDNGAGDNGAGDNGEGPSSRPIGRKAAKGKAREESAVVGVLRSQARASRSALNTFNKEMKRKRMLLETTTNDGIMTMKVDGMDDIQAAYIKARQQQIYERFCRQQESRSDDETVEDEDSSDENEEEDE